MSSSPRQARAPGRSGPTAAAAAVAATAGPTVGATGGGAPGARGGTGAAAKRPPIALQPIPPFRGGGGGGGGGPLQQRHAPNAAAGASAQTTSSAKSKMGPPSSGKAPNPTPTTTATETGTGTARRAAGGGGEAGTNGGAGAGAAVKAKHTSSRLAGEKKQEFKDPAKIGPWRLGEIIGRGASGRVRIAEHAVTKVQAAVKIVPKHILVTSRMSLREVGAKQDKMTLGIEREIVIMKLIEHPNLLGLWDVYETSKELFLIMEYVAGGELFDHLVQRGRLSPPEARSYFRQIMFGMDYCHRFNICHRDLKPENLLLDASKRVVKVADFGMAALQPTERMLETSCGSPHYASPEIVSGKRYKGTASDIWSCGIILFALLCGRLPFDDKDIGQLLAKVKVGRFDMPDHVEPAARDLIWRMLEVEPERRIRMADIMRHPWFTDHGRKTSQNPVRTSMDQLASGRYEARELDADILGNLRTLWPEYDEAMLVGQLTSPGMNWQKTFYTLLVQHRENHSADDDDEEADKEPPPPPRTSSQQTSRATSTAAPQGSHVGNSLGLDLGTPGRTEQRARSSVDATPDPYRGGGRERVRPPSGRPHDGANENGGSQRGGPPPTPPVLVAHRAAPINPTANSAASPSTPVKSPTRSTAAVSPVHQLPVRSPRGAPAEMQPHVVQVGLSQQQQQQQQRSPAPGLASLDVVHPPYSSPIRGRPLPSPTASPSPSPTKTRASSTSLGANSTTAHYGGHASPGLERRSSTASSSAASYVPPHSPVRAPSALSPAVTPSRRPSFTTDVTPRQGLRGSVGSEAATPSGAGLGDETLNAPASRPASRSTSPVRGGTHARGAMLATQALDGDVGSGGASTYLQRPQLGGDATMQRFFQELADELASIRGATAGVEGSDRLEEKLRRLRDMAEASAVPLPPTPVTSHAPSLLPDQTSSARSPAYNSASAANAAAAPASRPPSRPSSAMSTRPAPNPTGGAYARHAHRGHATSMAVEDVARFDDAEDDASEVGTDVNSLRSTVASEASSPFTPLSPLPPPLPSPHVATVPLHKQPHLQQQTAAKGTASTDGGLMGVGGTTRRPSVMAAATSPRPASVFSNFSAVTAASNGADVAPTSPNSATLGRKKSLLGRRKESGGSGHNHKRYATEGSGGDGRSSASVAYERLQEAGARQSYTAGTTTTATNAAAAANASPTRLQQANPGLGLNLGNGARYGHASSSIAAPSSVRGPVMPLASPVPSDRSSLSSGTGSGLAEPHHAHAHNVASPRQLWFARLFNWKPASFQLYSCEAFAPTYAEVKRLLVADLVGGGGGGGGMMARAFVEESSDANGAATLKCSMAEIKEGNATVAKPVRFRVEFTMVAMSAPPTTPSSFSPHPGARTPSTLVGGRSPALSTHSRLTSTSYDSEHQAAAAGGTTTTTTTHFGTNVTLVQEKGALSTFKAVYHALRKQWCLDQLAPPPTPSSVASSSHYAAGRSRPPASPALTTSSVGGGGPAVVGLGVGGLR